MPEAPLPQMPPLDAWSPVTHTVLAHLRSALARGDSHDRVLREAAAVFIGLRPALPIPLVREIVAELLGPPRSLLHALAHPAMPLPGADAPLPRSP